MFGSPGSKAAQRKRVKVATGQFLLLDSIAGSFNGSAVTFNLTSASSAVIPGNPQNLIVSLGGVIQTPTTAYTVSGSTITFTSAPATNEPCFIVMFNPVINPALLTAAGSNTQIQYNSSGTVAGSSSFTWNSATSTVNVGSATINSTTFSGTANNSTNLGGVAASGYVNTSSTTTISYTPTRVLQTQYQNTSGKLMYVLVSTNRNASGFAMFGSVSSVNGGVPVGSTPNANSIISAAYPAPGAGYTVNCGFLVPNCWYYSVISNDPTPSNVTLVYWAEYTLPIG